MFKIFIFVFIASLHILGCSGSNRSLKPSYISNCETIIEGSLHSEGEWLGDYPAIVVKTYDGEHWLSIIFDKKAKTSAQHYTQLWFVM